MKEELDKQIIKVKVTLRVLLKAVSEVTIDSHFTVRNFFLLFQLNAHNMLNTCIYRLLTPTYFGFCYTICRETIALFAQKLCAFLQCCYMGNAIEYKVYKDF